MLSSKQENYGYTLIEIITTLIIVGVLAAIAAPNLFNLYRRYQLTDAFRQLESSIKISQKQAKRLRKTCKIKLDLVNVNGKTRNRIAIVQASDPGERKKSYSGCLMKEIIFPEFIELETNIPGSTNKINFSHKGNTTTSGTIKLFISNLDLDRCLVISNGLGIIRTGRYYNTTSKLTSEQCKRE